MKTYLSIILCLVFAAGVFGQGVATSYKGSVSTPPNIYNSAEYGFSLTLPDLIQVDSKFNDASEFVASYRCALDVCKVPGVFAFTKASKLKSKTQTKDAVSLFQQKEMQETFAKALLDGFPSASNATVLSKKYAAYNGKPSVRIDYNFISEGISLSGALVILFIEERQMLAGFTFFSANSYADQWVEIGEKSLRSLVVNKAFGGIPARNSNVLTVRGDRNIISPPPPPASPGVTIPKKISGGVLNGKAVEFPKPEYPAAARAVRASGAVNVQVTIDEQGKVISASAVSGHPLLRQAAEQAARLAVFNSTILSGQPVSVTGIIVYNFVP